MDFLKRVAAAATVLVVMVGPAWGQWVHEQGEDDPFAGGATHMAITLSQHGEGILFRCTSSDDLALLFISIEKPMPEQVALFSKLKVQIQVIIDDDKVVEHDAEIDTTPDGDRYRFTAASPDLAILAQRAAGAKKRFAIAIKLMGKRLYSTAVGVRGSRAAISKLATGCGLAN